MQNSAGSTSPSCCGPGESLNNWQKSSAAPPTASSGSVRKAASRAGITALSKSSGIRSRSVKGDRCTRFFPRSNPIRSKKLLGTCGAVDQYREALALHQSGRLVDVSISLTPHMEAPGILVGFSAIIRDTTTRRQAEKALLQNEKLASVGRLASSIAHEINNPLESVTNLLYILSTHVEDAETRQFVATAQEELARVSHIATHTLRFHKQSSNRTEVDLQLLAESILALYRARLDSSNVVAVPDCRGSLRLLCYEGEMRQILVNLVANAYDAMRTGGKLWIRAHAGRNWKTGRSGLRILVADNGAGMDSDTQARIFEPFFSTKGIGGTGLGLWITKDLVAKNGGRVTVRSTTRPGRSGT